MKKLWITSSEASVSFHRPADGNMQFVDLALSAPDTESSTSIACPPRKHPWSRAAELAFAKKILAPHQKKVSMTRNGITDQAISSLKEPWMGCGDLVVGAAAVLDRKDEDRREDQDRSSPPDSGQVEYR